MVLYNNFYSDFNSGFKDRKPVGLWSRRLALFLIFFISNFNNNTHINLFFLNETC